MEGYTLNTSSCSKWIIDHTAPYTMIEKDDSLGVKTGKCLIGFVSYFPTVKLAICESIIALIFLSVVKTIELAVGCFLSNKCLTCLNANIIDPTSRYAFSSMSHVAIATTRLYSNFFDAPKQEEIRFCIKKNLSPLFASPSVWQELTSINTKINDQMLSSEEVDQIIKTVKKHTGNPNADIRALATLTLSALVQKNYQHAFEDALAVALVGRKDTDSEVQSAAIKTLCLLVEKNYEPAFMPGFDFAVEALHCKDTDLYTVALDILVKLLEHGNMVDAVGEQLQKLRETQIIAQEALQRLESAYGLATAAPDPEVCDAAQDEAVEVEFSFLSYMTPLYRRVVTPFQASARRAVTPFRSVWRRVRGMKTPSPQADSPPSSADDRLPRTPPQPVLRPLPQSSPPAYVSSPNSPPQADSPILSPPPRADASLTPASGLVHQSDTPPPVSNHPHQNITPFSETRPRHLILNDWRGSSPRRKLREDQRLVYMRRHEAKS